MPDFLKTVRDRVVIYDGAMGTNIQLRRSICSKRESTPSISICMD